MRRRLRSLTFFLPSPFCLWQSLRWFSCVSAWRHLEEFHTFSASSFHRTSRYASCGAKLDHVAAFASVIESGTDFLDLLFVRQGLPFATAPTVVRTSGIYSSCGRACRSLRHRKWYGQLEFTLRGAKLCAIGSAPKVVRITGRLSLRGAKLCGVVTALKVVGLLAGAQIRGAAVGATSDREQTLLPALRQQQGCAHSLCASSHVGFESAARVFRQ